MALNPLGPIFNASSITLDQNPGTLPNMMESLREWFQPITFGVLTKSVVNFQVVEAPTVTIFFGVWQPMRAYTISMKPEGQRAWQWYTLHAHPSPSLAVDNIALRNGIQYRVMAKRDFTQYGYCEYELANDYSGSGPGTY